MAASPQSPTGSTGNPPFLANPLTTTQQHGGAEDKQPPLWGNLDPAGITSLTALSGTTGTETQLIDGDVWYQKQGHQMDNILKNLTTTVTQNETRTVIQNLKNKVVGTTNDIRVAVHNHTNFSSRNDEFLHTRSEIHHETENRHQKTEDNDKTEKRNKFIEKHFEQNYFKLTVFYGPEINLNGVVAFESKALATAVKVISAEHVTLECELHEIGTAISIVASQVVASVKAKLAPLHAKAVGANLNAGIAANGDSPLG